MIEIQNLSHELARSALDFILPPICYQCHTALSEPNQICGPCWQNINFITRPLCAINGTPLPFDLGDASISAPAIANPPIYRRARAVAHYDGVMRDLIHQFKYHDKHELVALFAKWLEQAAIELLQECDLFIPIPLYRWRLWQRRFNQSALLCQALSARTGHEVECQSLIRSKKTKPQVGLSKNARQRNVEGAFKVTGAGRHNFSGKTILLIDDIITTGATVNTAASALLAAGAANVDILCLARVTQETLLTP